MPRLAKLALKIILVVLLGGFFSAALVRFAPGFGVDEAEMDSRLNASSIQALRQENTSSNSFAGLYLQYLRGLLHGDLGQSRTLQQPVAQLLRDRFPQTVRLVVPGLLLGWFLGLAAAVISVLARTKSLDLAVGLFVGILLCLPASVLALLAVLAQAPAQLLIAVVILPKIYRYSRNLLSKTVTLPHILTARAKGAGEMRILFWHIAPLLSRQLIALAGVSLTVAFTAAIPIEALCDVAGIGQLAWKAALGRDVSLLITLTTLVTLITVIANSGSDLMERSTALETA